MCPGRNVQDRYVYCSLGCDRCSRGKERTYPHILLQVCQACYVEPGWNWNSGMFPSSSEELDTDQDSTGKEDDSRITGDGNGIYWQGYHRDGRISRGTPVLLAVESWIWWAISLTRLVGVNIGGQVRISLFLKIRWIDGCLRSKRCFICILPVVGSGQREYLPSINWTISCVSPMRRERIVVARKQGSHIANSCAPHPSTHSSDRTKRRTIWPIVFCRACIS